jgi:Mn2+/Fe2+ NRAMP family transporter
LDTTKIRYDMFRKIGPGMLVAAAFIGPGTVTVCTLAGVGFGFSLLWALLIATLSTIVLQEMSARLGLISRMGLADVIRRQLETNWIKYTMLAIVLGAIVIGNAAYEAGNIGGATLGMEALFGPDYSQFYPWVIGLFAFALLWQGKYKVLERVFVLLVVLMSVSFLITAGLTRPDILPLVRGLFKPEIPEGGLFTLIALVGTTVVPYNLFLHASIVSEKWGSATHLSTARWDTILSIALGGIVSMAIVISAAAIPAGEISGALDLARGLEPLYGEGARYCMGIGLLAAGITSAITAPLAAAYVANSCFGWNAKMNDYRFRLTWILILLAGVLSLSMEIHPLEIIHFAQVANGLLLPLIAVFLLWSLNQSELLGKYRNTLFQNILAILIILFAIFLGLRSIAKVLDAI